MLKLKITYALVFLRYTYTLLQC